jgi:hypothetical protein
LKWAKGRAPPRLLTKAGAKRFSPWDEIGTKHATCSFAVSQSEPTMKTFICLSLAFVLAASVAVISMTSPETGRAANTVSDIY